jgi:GMP reductase
MRIEREIRYDFDDVLIRPKRSTLDTRAKVELNRTFTMLHSKWIWRGMPIIASNMRGVATFKMAETLDESHMLTALHKCFSVSELVDFFKRHDSIEENIFYTIGMLEEDLAKLKKIKEELLGFSDRFIYFPRLLCIDVANGYTQSFHKWVQRVRELYPFSTIMAGNVATAEMVQQLTESGADIIKVGIGPGATCETRRVTGVGYPQLSSIIEAADCAHGYGSLVCADGGCRFPGDVAKAFCAGGDFVMLGSMLAGTDECDGEWETESEIIHSEEHGGIACLTGNRIKKSMKFYGNSSKEAMENNGGMAEYRAAEGKCVQVPYKGSVTNVVQDILGGLRSCGTYIGASCLKDFSKCCTFISVHRTHNTFFGN